MMRKLILLFICLLKGYEIDAQILKSRYISPLSQGLVKEYVLFSVTEELIDQFVTVSILEAFAQNREGHVLPGMESRSFKFNHPFRSGRVIQGTLKNVRLQKLLFRDFKVNKNVALVEDDYGGSIIDNRRPTLIEYSLGMRRNKDCSDGELSMDSVCSSSKTSTGSSIFHSANLNTHKIIHLKGKDLRISIKGLNIVATAEFESEIVRIKDGSKEVINGEVYARIKNSAFIVDVKPEVEIESGYPTVVVTKAQSFIGDMYTQLLSKRKLSTTATLFRYAVSSMKNMEQYISKKIEAYIYEQMPDATKWLLTFALDMMLNQASEQIKKIFPKATTEIYAQNFGFAVVDKEIKFIVYIQI